MRIQDDGKSLRPAAQEKTGDHQRMEWLSWKRILVENGRVGRCARACPTEQVRKVRRAGESDAKHRFEQTALARPAFLICPVRRLT